MFRAPAVWSDAQGESVAFKSAHKRSLGDKRVGQRSVKAPRHFNLLLYFFSTALFELSREFCRDRLITFDKMVGPAGETLNRRRTNSLSQLAAQTAAAEGDEALGSAIFSLREKWVVGRAGLEPATT